MVVLNYKDNRKKKKDVKALFLSAFPKDERPPAYYFFSSALKETNNIYAFYEKEAFIGFIQLTTFKDICYVFFLAVKKELRCQGWGSKILSWIKEFQKDKVILLCYEEVDEKYKDNEARIKRRDFYIKKNGFKSNHLKTNEFGVIFETCIYGNHFVPFEDYVEIFVLGFSEYAREHIKRAD